MFTFPIFMIISEACPNGVEAMSMALMGMVINTNFSTKGQMGLLINRMFADCKNDQLESCYGNLTVYALIGTCLPFLFIPLMVPNKPSKGSEASSVLSAANQ